MFDNIRSLRRRLDAVDSGCQNGHYRDGHTLPCTFTGCTSKLRMLRATCPHYVELRMFVCHLYEAVRNHKFIAFIDRALRAGKFRQLAMMCEFSDYQVLFASYGYSLGTVHCEVGKDVCALNIQKPNQTYM